MQQSDTLLQNCLISSTVSHRRKTKTLLKKISSIKSNEVKVASTSNQALVDKIKRTSFMRKFDQLNIIIKALTLSELNTYLSKSLLIDKENVLKIITLLAPLCTYASFKAEHSLFSIGEKTRKAYILINGTIKLTKAEISQKTVAPYEYYTIISRFIKDNDSLLLEKTIEANQAIYPIDKEDVSNLNLILFKKVICSLDIENQEDYEEQVYKSMLLFHIKPYQLDLSSISPIERSTIGIKLSYISINKVNQYSYLLDNKTTKEIRVYGYNDYIINAPGSFIGNNDINSDHYYKEAALSVTQTELLTIPYEVYLTEISLERKRVVDREASFFLKNFFFHSIPKTRFAKQYLDLFSYSEYTKDEMFIREGKTCGEIFFVKEGTIKLSMNKSPFEVHLLISYLNRLVRSNEQEGQDLERLREEESEDYYRKIMNNPRDIIDLYTARRQMKLFEINDREMILSECCFYGINSVLTAKVVSKKAIIYRLPLVNLMRIFRDEPEAYKSFEDYSHHKMMTLVMRLTDINSLIISQIDFQYSSYLSTLKQNNQISIDKINKPNDKGNTSASPIGQFIIKDNMDMKKICNRKKSNQLIQSNGNWSINPAMKVKKKHSLHKIENNLIKRLTQEINLNDIHLSSLAEPINNFDQLTSSFPALSNSHWNEISYQKKRSSSLYLQNVLLNQNKCIKDNKILQSTTNPKKSLYSLSNKKQRLESLCLELKTASTYFDSEREHSNNNKTNSNDCHNYKSNDSFDFQITNSNNIIPQCFTLANVTYSFPHRFIYDHNALTSLHKRNIKYKKDIINTLN